MRASWIAASLAMLALPLAAAATEPRAHGGQFQIAASDKAKDADNTQRNVKDRNDAAVNPMDQGGSEADRRITQHIRKTVVDNDKLSMNAHNVKIITVDGVVTLRGPVKSAAEKSAIKTAAAKTEGVKKVDDQLEIEKNP
jgi:hyperosmotically inducible periplasmic protein